MSNDIEEQGTKVTQEELRDAAYRALVAMNPELSKPGSTTKYSPETMALAIALLQVEATRELMRVTDGIDSCLANVIDHDDYHDGYLRVRNTPQ